MSPYQYCSNNPISKIEIDGLEGAPFMAIGAFIGAASNLGGQILGNLPSTNGDFVEAFNSVDWVSVGASASSPFFTPSKLPES